MEESVPSANVERFRDKIDKIHQVFGMEEYFTSRWTVGETEFYEIGVDSTPDSFGKSIPTGVSISGYSLRLDVLSPSSLEDILD